MKNKYEIINDEIFIVLSSKVHGNMKAIVDLSDLPKLNSFPNTWMAQYSKFTDSFYAVGYTLGGKTNRKRVFLHRYIMDTPKGLDVDHINHNTLDNRRANLRNCSRSANCSNKGGYGVSGYKYIYPHRDNMWKIKKDNKHIGCFNTLEEAKEVLGQLLKKGNE